MEAWDESGNDHYLRRRRQAVGAADGRRAGGRLIGPPVTLRARCERTLTTAEIDIVRAAFGSALDPEPVRVRRRKWFPLQPPATVMAPCGHLHFHPASSLYRDDFGAEGPALQALFVHEMTHVWQAQRHGRLWLPLLRHPFCRYDYTLVPNRPLGRYGIEQQAEIVAHGWLALSGAKIPGERQAEPLLALLPVNQQSTRYS